MGIVEWWNQLSTETQNMLLDHPDGPVPPDVVAEVTKAGQPVAGAWWPSTQSGPDGLYLRGDAARWVRAHAKAREYQHAFREYHDEMERLIPWRVGEPKESVPAPSEEDLERLRLLDERQRELHAEFRAAWRE